MLKMFQQNKRLTVPNDYRLSCTIVMQPKSNDTQCPRWSDLMPSACSPAEQHPLCFKELVWSNEWIVHFIVHAQAALHQLPLHIGGFKTSQLPIPVAIWRWSGGALWHPWACTPSQARIKGSPLCWPRIISLHAQIPWMAVRFSSVKKKWINLDQILSL